MPIYVGYLRDSGGAEQDQSTAQQRQAIENWAQAGGHVVSRWFVDAARPGSSVVRREAFQDMMSHFRHGATEAGVVIWNYSRFSREIDDSIFFRADLRRRGYALVSVTDAIPEGNIGRLFEAILDYKNAQYLEDMSRDIKRGLADLVQTYGAVPGTPPRGFMRVPVEIGKRRDGSAHIAHRWQPDPAMVGRVQLAFEMRAARARIMDIHQATRLYKSVTCYETMYPNQLYKGVLEYGSLVIADYCEPVVDPVTWQAAQAKKQQIHPRRVNSSYLLSGLAYCARCGAPLSGRSVRGWQAYGCTRQLPHRLCDLQPIPARPLESAVVNTIIEQALSDDNLAAIYAAYVESLDETKAAAVDQRARLQADWTANQRQVERITDAIAQAGASAALLDKLRRLEMDGAAILAELQSSAIPEPESLGDYNQRAARLRENVQADRATAQAALRGLVERIIVDRDGRRISGMVETYFTAGNSVGAYGYTLGFTATLRPWTRRS